VEQGANDGTAPSVTARAMPVTNGDAIATMPSKTRRAPPTKATRRDERPTVETPD